MSKAHRDTVEWVRAYNDQLHAGDELKFVVLGIDRNTGLVRVCTALAEGHVQGDAFTVQAERLEELIVLHKWKVYGMDEAPDMTLTLVTLS